MMAPWGHHVDIDCGIAKLIQLVWSLGIGTCLSCEDTEGEVEIGVPRVDIAVWCWAFAHFNENPPREQLVAWRRKLEKLQRALRKQAVTQMLAWYRQEIEELRREIQNEPLARHQELEYLKQEMLEYEKKGNSLEIVACRLFFAGRAASQSGLALDDSSSEFDLLQIPCERLPHVEANCEAALRAGRCAPAGNAP
jgi:hypothetical protein